MSAPITITVLFFASIREAVGQSREVLTTQAPTLAALRAQLIARGDAYATSLAEGRAVRMSLNQVLSAGDAALKAGDEVAFFPPVTGG